MQHSLSRDDCNSPSTIGQLDRPIAELDRPILKLPFTISLMSFGSRTCIYTNQDILIDALTGRVTRTGVVKLVLKELTSDGASLSNSSSKLTTPTDETYCTAIINLQRNFTGAANKIHRA